MKSREAVLNNEKFKEIFSEYISDLGLDKEIDLPEWAAERKVMEEEEKALAEKKRMEEEKIRLEKLALVELAI